VKGPILRIDAGSTPYPAAYEWQRDLHARRVAGKIPDVLLLLEHPHVFTLGRRFRSRHLLAEPAELRRRGIEVFEADRGGSITYHGPGQLVAYPVVDLRTEQYPHADVLAYLRLLEAATLETVLSYGVAAEPRPGLTGVWVGSQKVASIGVNVSRGVSKHGMALNVTTDLDFFRSMVPCGIPGAGVTSLQRLGCPAPIWEVAGRFAGILARKLDRRVVAGTLAGVGLEHPSPALEAAHG
jgi:lipoyl(octanoyl) transferase